MIRRLIFALVAIGAVPAVCGAVEKDDDVRAIVEGFSAKSASEMLAFSFMRVDSDIFPMLSKLQNLKSLGFGWCRFEEKDLEFIAQCPSLIALDLTGASITDKAFAYLSKARTLERLNLACTKVSGEHFEELGPVPLKSLDLSYTNITDDALRLISRLESLEDLNLNGTSVSDKGLEHLRTLYRLRYLNVVNTRITEDGVDVFFESNSASRATAVAKGLISRDYQKLTISDTVFKSRLDSTEAALVTEFQICGAKCTGDEDNAITSITVDKDCDVDRVLDLVVKVPEVQEFQIIGRRIQPEWFARLSKLPKLAKINLTECTVRDEDLSALGQLPKLKELDLSYTAVSDPGLAHLSSLKQLEGLRLSHTRVTGSGLHSLTTLPLRRLYLMATPITDDSLNAIGKINTLQVLNLNRTGVTDAGLARLGGLYRLVSLSTSSANVSTEAREALLKTIAVAHADAEKKGLLKVEPPKPTKEQKLVKELHEKFGVESTLDRQGAIFAVIVEGERIDDAPGAIKRLSKIDTIQWLHIQHTTLDRALLESIAKLPNLSKLDLGSCQFDEQDLGVLKQLPNLREFELYHAPLTDAGLSQIKLLKKVERLRLDGTRITGKSFAELQSLPLTSLHLSFVKLSDDSLEALGKIQTLKTLDLSYTPMTDDGLKHLIHLDRLLSLSVGKSVTDEGMENFRKQHSLSQAKARKKRLLPRNYPEFAIGRPG